MTEGERDAAALDWVRRIHDPTFDDWDAHLAWLEADAANGRAFEAMALRIEALTDGLAPAPAIASASETQQPLAGNDNAPYARRTWLVGGTLAALAATLVAALVLPHGPADRGDTIVTTAPGERRVVALDDGTQIALNGGSRLVLAAGQPRRVTLASGEAFFSVVHDAAQPFEVATGSATIRDVGTTFNVTRDRDRLEIGVREGSVDVTSGAGVTHLPAGHGLVEAAGARRTEALAPSDVGGWRDGRLVYADASIERVARDLSRTTGVPIRVAAPLEQRRFTGILVLGADRQRAASRFAAAAGLEATHDAHGWVLRASHR